MRVLRFRCHSYPIAACFACSKKLEHLPLGTPAKPAFESRQLNTHMHTWYITSGQPPRVALKEEKNRVLIWWPRHLWRRTSSYVVHQITKENREIDPLLHTAVHSFRVRGSFRNERYSCHHVPESSPPPLNFHQKRRKTIRNLRGEGK